MPKRIILLRHGETDLNQKKILQGHLDTFLNNNGLKQARNAALKLKKEKVDAVFSSDLQRAYNTALIAVSDLNLEIIKTELLRERYFGKLQGLTLKEIRKYIWKFGEETGYETAGWEEEYGIETNKQIIKRLELFKSQLKKYKNKNVLVVSHGALMRHLMIILGVSKEIAINIQIENTASLILNKVKEDYYTLNL